VDVTTKNIAIQLIITAGVVMASENPIFPANSREVNLRSRRLPATFPKF